MSKIRKTFKFRLWPTRKQQIILEGQLALCCELYNASLEERIGAYRIAYKPISFRSQSNQLPEVKQERHDLNAVYSQVLQDVLRRVDRSFDGFFRRVKLGQKAGFPRFRSCRRYDSLTYPQSGFNLEERHLRLSKIGRIKIKLHRPIQGCVKTVTIKRDAGTWYACFSVEYEAQPLTASTQTIAFPSKQIEFEEFTSGFRAQFRNQQRTSR